MGTRSRILVVDDEADICEMVQTQLTRSGYRCCAAASAEEAERLIRSDPPDLILLDWMLPGRSGVELARKLRRSAQTREIAIIMLTARDGEEERVTGLESGADDYITKPFSARELVARIRALLRRTTGNAPDGLLEEGELSLNPLTQDIRYRKAPIHFGPTEFRLLYFLMSHPEQIFSRQQILDQVWGHHQVLEERTVDVHIRRLRKGLEASGLEHLIQTVRGSGYRFSSRS